jgi:DNA-directed RNA polymerase subunit RPC12/RpoP
MTGKDTSYECARCGEPFPPRSNHTEIVRRDFVELPQPTRIERLCPDCWKAYVSEFLGEDFEALLSAHETG